MNAETLLYKTLGQLRHGQLEVVAPSGNRVFGEPGGLSSTLVVENPAFFQRAVFGRNDGAGDSYTDGDWWSPDLVSLIRLVVRNLDAIQSGSRFLSAASRIYYRLLHALRANTVSGSRRNIAAHYDLSNDFFGLFLDSGMMYSCAVFENETDSLETAQMRKLERICRKLSLGPGDHVLEIGTGWGGFAELAATRFGCRVTTTTISREQHAAARERFARLGSAGESITLLLEDYRKLKGVYDKIVSIEMFEAVGLAHYDDFFRACDRLLRPDGSMLIQTITMNEQRFADYHRHSDWIQRRIFPGGELASFSEILRSVGRVTGLTLVGAEDFGIHYALTLRRWRSRFLDARRRVLQLGFDERFIRMWDYYFAYCEGAFLERYIGVSQIAFTRMHHPRALPGDPAAAGRRHHEQTVHNPA